MNPTMLVLAVGLVQNEARSALPNAPVVPDPEPAHRVRALRTATARALRAFATRIDPAAPQTSTTYG